MGLPGHIPHGGSGHGHGPFGAKAFRAALIGCAVLIAIGVVMLAAGGDAVRGAGVALVVLCGVGLLTVGGLLLAERRLGRTPPPPPEVRGANGRGRYSPQRRRPPRR